MNLNELESQALALSPDDRAELARRLLLSLDETTEAEFDHLWGEESSRRAAELDRGSAQLISGDEVAKKARALLR